MNIYTTLDYELFSGANAGTVENSIIKPTELLVKIADTYGAKLLFFVDTGYLEKLSNLKNIHPSIDKDYTAIAKQIEKLQQNGHDIQLHVHPHWEDCTYDGNTWQMDTNRFRIHDFSDDVIEDIVRRQKKALTDLVGDTVFAYRAGGWCLQPFDKLKDILKKEGVWLDSTVYSDGYNSSETHFFDFRNAPKKDIWTFNDDPVKEVENGYFTEVPISTCKVSPLFYWKYLITKKLGTKQHQVYADGTAAGGSSNSSIVKMLTKSSNALVSVDGYRSSLLQKALNGFTHTSKEGHFVIIGHPKALSPYSLKQYEKFLKTNHKEHNFCTFSDVFNLK